MKKQRLLHCTLATLLGLALAALLLWLGARTTVRADASIHCVNQTGSGCGPGICGGGCYASVQAAVDASDPGHEIRVAGGTYTDTAGTVAVITKELRIIGAFDPAFETPDPDIYHTMLDAKWGGTVISITDAGDVLLQHLIVVHGDGTDNCGSGFGCGGGVYIKNTSVHVEGCEIMDNVGSRTGGGSGGGIYAYGSAVEMRSSRVVSNAASTDPVASGGGWGGGIYVNVGSVSLAENEILDNVGRTSYTGAGGGVYLFAVTSADVLTNVIRGNKAGVSTWASDGGGLWLGESSAVYVASNRIENNWTSPSGAGYGGGVCVRESDAHLTRNIINNNSTGGSAAVRPGGGVCIGSTKQVTLSNNLIIRNDAHIYGGGVYVSMYSPAIPSCALLVNNTIADNGGSGVAVRWYAEITLTNNIVAGHGTGLSTLTPFTGTIFADMNLFCNATDPVTGVNGMRQNPLLTADYRPRVGSPAIDAGLTIPWLTTDLDGNSRPQGSGYDIGAFEGAGVWWKLFLPLVVRNS